LRAGELSTRDISRSTGHAISHDTVNRVLRGEGRPHWRSLELVVKALGGDVETFRTLWLSGRQAEGQGGD
jgi:hypothetical protein